MLDIALFPTSPGTVSLDKTLLLFNKALTCHLTYTWLIFPYFSQNNVQSSERTDSPLALIRQCSSCSHCFYHPCN